MGSRKFQEGLVTLASRRHGDLVEDAAGRGANHCRGVRVLVRVDPDDQIDGFSRAWSCVHSFAGGT